MGGGGVVVSQWIGVGLWVRLGERWRAMDMGRTKGRSIDGRRGRFMGRGWAMGRGGARVRCRVPSEGWAMGRGRFMG